MSVVLFRLMLLMWPGVCTAVFALISGFGSDLTALLLKLIAFVYVVAAPSIIWVLHDSWKETK